MIQYEFLCTSPLVSDAPVLSHMVCRRTNALLQIHVGLSDASALCLRSISAARSMASIVLEKNGFCPCARVRIIIRRSCPRNSIRDVGRMERLRRPSQSCGQPNAREAQVPLRRYCTTSRFLGNAFRHASELLLRPIVPARHWSAGLTHTDQTQATAWKQTNSIASIIRSPPS